jgi:hypothetical protein
VDKLVVSLKVAWGLFSTSCIGESIYGGY